MADEKPQIPPPDESKKDTVRINLPAGLAGKATAAPAGVTPTVKLRPSPAPGAPPDEAKKETAVMGAPVTPPKPKKDTSRVEVPAAKPTVPEVPRPTVKLKREEAPVEMPTVASAPAPTVAPTTMSSAGPSPIMMKSGPSAIDVVLSVVAMIASLAVVGYLYMIVTS
jgi:hypothetical protein